MTFQELQQTVRSQLNGIMRLNPVPVTTAFLYATGTPQSADNKTQETNALTFAENLILCLDEDAVSKLLQRDQEQARCFFLVAMYENEKLVTRPPHLDASTFSEGGMPFYTVAAWMIDALKELQHAPPPMTTEQLKAEALRILRRKP